MTVIRGGCGCGAVRYEITDAPIFQMICHCTDCRKASGSAFAAVMLFAADRIAMLGSEPKYYEVEADSGRTMRRGFCEGCGAPILIRKPDVAQVAFIQVGSLDDPAIFKPDAEVFTCRAHSSLGPVQGAMRFDKGPAPGLILGAIEAHFRTRS